MKIAVGCALALPAQAEILWGTATAAYQVEGHRDADGRQPSIWDAFDTDGVSSVIKAKKPNGKVNVFNGENAGVADDDYAKYEDSADIMHDYGFATARLSISWPRVMTFTLDADSGRPIGKRNQAGIDHYKAVLNAYKKRNVAPAVTMWHWDTPLALEEYAMSQACGSFWLCHEWLGEYFEDYVQLIMDEFADLTSWWITLNEPLTIITNGYASGSHAPGRCSDRTQCWFGDSSTEPYLAAKGLTLAHARAFRVWEKAGRPGQGLGITLNGDWRIPQTDSAEDHDAQTRNLEWSVAIFADPVHYGRWPKSMVETLGDRLPAWTADEVELVNGTHDGHFFMNTYTTNFVRAAANDGCGYFCDSLAETSGYNFETQEPVGTPSTNGWLFNYGPGMAKLIEWYDARYPGLSYIVTENGWGSATNTMEEEAANDVIRCNFYRDYLGNMSAMTARTGIDVKAYFAWSLMDNYEWSDGFSVRFGLTYVDYDTQIRTPKMSAQWFKKYITPLKDLPTDGKPLPACDASVFTGSTLVV